MKQCALLPHPRFLRTRSGELRLPAECTIRFESRVPRDTLSRPLARQLRHATASRGFQIKTHADSGAPTVEARQSTSAPSKAEGYKLEITRTGVFILYRDVGGLRAGVATLCQLIWQFGRRLPCVQIRDWPDFARRSVLLDVSRGRVPTLKTLKQLATDLAGFKINELQLYFEHTFAYRDYPEVWRGWGALTGKDIQALDAHCRRLGIDLVPNQNSFGHLRHWLEQDRLKNLAEVQAPYPSADNTFLRRPSTLAPNHPGTLPFLRGLYDELLPNFNSQFFNVGCDETWDLGLGRSKALCSRKSNGQVYLEFLLKIHKEVNRRGKTLMFWGDIILNHPDLIQHLPENIVALNWGYEAGHPFNREARQFAAAGIPFYVCPGTSTWQTLIGRNDNAFANLREAARAGKRHGAVGYQITDWGDGGHPQPLAVSYPLYLAGASLAWCARTYSDALLAPVLSREVFQDVTGQAARACLALGVAHKQFKYNEPNATPFGATLAAPPSEQRELFCRNGLKYYARLSPQNIRAAHTAVKRARAQLKKAMVQSPVNRVLVDELDLAARMAEESCHYLLWQQALAKARSAAAREMAQAGIQRIAILKRDFRAYWSRRNKGTPSKCATFLDWRLEDYHAGRLHYSPEAAQVR